MEKQGIDCEEQPQNLQDFFKVKVMVKFEAFSPLCFSVCKNKWKQKLKKNHPNLFVSGMDSCERSLFHPWAVMR